jgi:ketosteroid isomerase-like protein
MPDADGGMTLERLSQFGDAWRRKDLDALMQFVTDDVVYSASVGPEPGETFRGRDAVRDGFARMLAHDGDAEARAGDVWLFGDRAVGLWSYVYDGADGAKVEVKGIDLYEFAGDRIRLKDAYRKTFDAGT